MDNNFTYNGIKLILTCGGYPEQYDALDANGKKVGYLRLRHGEFTVEVPGCGDKLVFEGSPEGGGIFEDHERNEFLKKAIDAILHDLNSAE
jgi:hypothetical protein